MRIENPYLAKKLSGMDPIGCLMFIGAVCCLLLALQWGGQSKPWESSTVIGLLIGFFALSCVFALLAWKRQDRALIPPRVFRRRSIFTGAMVLFFLGASTYLVIIPFMYVSNQRLTLHLECFLPSLLLPSRTRSQSHR